MEMDCEDFFGKTFLECSQTSPTPSDVSWQELSEQMIPWLHLTAQDGQVQVWLPGHGHGLRGGFSTVAISECPNDAAVSTLSQILETGRIPQRFFLSREAKDGVLRRAEKRGKELPEQLARALKAGED